MVHGMSCCRRFSVCRARGHWASDIHRVSRNEVKLGDKETKIYYYTPLPLNLASKQASKQQATLLLSVLAITPCQRFGLYSTLAILEPRWWPCQIRVVSQKFTGGAPGQRRQVGRCPPKTAHFAPQNSLFWPKTAPQPSQNGQTKGNGGYTPRSP